LLRAQLLLPGGALLGCGLLLSRTLRGLLL